MWNKKSLSYQKSSEGNTYSQSFKETALSKDSEEHPGSLAVRRTALRTVCQLAAMAEARMCKCTSYPGRRGSVIR